MIYVGIPTRAMTGIRTDGLVDRGANPGQVMACFEAHKLQLLSLHVNLFFYRLLHLSTIFSLAKIQGRWNSNR